MRLADIDRLLTVEEIMDLAGQLRTAGHRPGKGNAHLTAGQRRDIERRILDRDREESGETVAQIAADFGLTVQRVYQIAAEISGTRRRSVEVLERLHAEARDEILHGLSPKRANHFLVLAASHMKTYVRLAGESR
jgi:uncharacterized protein (DUF433 family)